MISNNLYAFLIISRFRAEIFVQETFSCQTADKRYDDAVIKKSNRSDLTSSVSSFTFRLSIPRHVNLDKYEIITYELLCQDSPQVWPVLFVYCSLEFQSNSFARRYSDSSDVAGRHKWIVASGDVCGSEKICLRLSHTYITNFLNNCG